MAEEATDAKPASEPSAEASTESKEVVNTPEGEQPSQPVAEKEQPFHEHPRFKELIAEKNDYKERLSKMETVLQEKFNPRPDPFSQAQERLVKLGMKEDAAKEVLEAVKMVSSNYTDQRVAPIEQSAVKAEVDGWIDNFRRSHEDFDALEPKIYEAYKALPSITQQVIASDPMGLELLYDHVKVQNMKDELKKAESRGAKSAYENKQIKSGMSPTPGANNPPGGFTRESIASMNNTEYAKNKAAIWAALREGKISE